MAGKKKKYRSFNPYVVFPVAAATVIVLAVFFLSRSNRGVETVTDTVAAPVDTFDIRGYYMQEAEGFVQSLPDDKVVVARRVDSVWHHIYYYEKGDYPSCYVYDLDSRRTTVLFSGNGSFYCDDRELILGAISDCRLVDDCLFFVARNSDPNSGYPASNIVFGINIDNYVSQFVDSCAEASFVAPNRLAVVHAVMFPPSGANADTTYKKSKATIEVKAF